MDHPQQPSAELICPPRAGSLISTAAIAFLCLILVAISILWHRYDPTLGRENGPMENFEAICLFGGLWALVWRMRKLEMRAERIFVAGLALFFVTFLVLEVDVRHSGIRPLIKIMNGRIRDVWLGALWVGAIALFVKNAHCVWPLFVQWLSSQSGRLMLCAGGLWLASSAVDKALLVEKDLFLEELFEVPATMLMLLSAIMAKKKCRNPHGP